MLTLFQAMFDKEGPMLNYIEESDNSKQQTPLHIAAKNGHVDVVKVTGKYVLSAHDILSTGISKYRYLLYQRKQFRNILYFYFHFNSFYLKLLISQSKFSGPRKFSLRYQ